MQAWPRPWVPSLPSFPGRPRLRTAAGRLAEVGPAEGGTARLYVCGITPYDATHLGHANTYVAFDLLQRVWLDAGLSVRYCQNVTDVDDPLLERADATGVDWRELAADQIELFRGDMTALNVIPPDDLVGVVEALPLVVDLIARLQAEGWVYAVDDAQYPDLYFRSARVPGLLDAPSLDVATALALFGERGGDPDRPGKEDALDCLVWRLERPGEPAWDAELGRGRPGWHVECTAIALAHLGGGFDVQGGGSDLAFPHHAMCSAQGRVSHRDGLATASVHAGMVGYQGSKMSKSLGNLVLVSRLRAAGEDPAAIRLALLAHHYASDWEYTDADLDAARVRLSSYRREASLELPDDVLLGVRRALRDNLDAPRALALLDALVSDPHAGASGVSLATVLDALLGIRLVPDAPVG